MKRLFTFILIAIQGVQTIMAQQITSIDSILSNYDGNGTPGASLMVIKNGKPVYTKSYGYADLENKTLVEPASNFRLASVTKQFTATGILQLINKEKLSLANTLTQVFPGFPAYGKNITIRHLLNHTSGLPDYENYVEDTAFNPQIKDQGVLDILMKTDTPYFEPGTKYQYSNSAYALLALIIEKYSGLSFAAYLKQNIFDPLDMNSTVAYEKGISNVKNRAYGYSRQNDVWILKDQSSTSAVLGDGGIYSNVEDLFKWNQSLYSGKILPLHLIQQASSYNTLNNGDTVHYGFGWHLKRNAANEQVVYHTGSTTSFRNIFYRIPEKKFSVILLTNRNRPQEEDMVGLAEKIIAAFEKHVK